MRSRIRSGGITAIVGLFLFVAAIMPVSWQTSSYASSSPRTQAQVICSPAALFNAAVAKEHFDPNDPSYAQLGPSQGPKAYGAVCRDGWAFAAISRPNVGTTDGFTLFKETPSGVWMEVRETGPNHDACTLAQLGVPGKVAIVLARGIAGGEFCDNPTAYAEARALWILGRCSALTELTNGLQGWQYVATSLQGGEPAYGGNPTGYKLAISELRQILAIAKSGTVMYGPGWENGNTYTSSNPSFKIDILRLNSFFKTPGVYLQDASTMICGTS